MHELQTPTEIIWVFLGIAGGVVRVFFNYLAETTPPTLGKFLIILSMNMFISGFAGYLGAVLGSTLTDNDQLHVVFAGITGYMGVSSLDWIAMKLKSKYVV